VLEPRDVLYISCRLPPSTVTVYDWCCTTCGKLNRFGEAETGTFSFTRDCLWERDRLSHYVTLACGAGLTIRKAIWTFGSIKESVAGPHVRGNPDRRATSEAMASYLVVLWDPPGRIGGMAALFSCWADVKTEDYSR
jgi:hypothetical protein